MINIQNNRPIIQMKARKLDRSKTDWGLKNGEQESNHLESILNKQSFLVMNANLGSKILQMFHEMQGNKRLIPRCMHQFMPIYISILVDATCEHTNLKLKGLGWVTSIALQRKDVMETMKIANLMELPPKVLMEDLFTTGSENVYYPRPLLDMWMKSVRTPHESPAGWTSSPLPQGPLSPIRPERQNYDGPMGYPFEDFHSGGGSQSSIDNQRPSFGVTKGKNEPASVLMEGLTANLKDIGLGGNDTNPMAVPGNSDDVRSIPSSASGQGIPSEGNSGRSGRKRPHSASGGNIRLEPLLEMSHPDVHFKLSSSPEQVPAFDQAPSPSTRVLFCADHPYLVGTARGDAVWKRLQEHMHACGFDTISNILADVENLLKRLQNCMHASGFDIISNILANAENLVKIFDTPDGLISSGKMGTGKSAKKPDKGKAAMEEACMREKVREIQKNLSSMLLELSGNWQFLILISDTVSFHPWYAPNNQNMWNLSFK